MEARWGRSVQVVLAGVLQLHFICIVHRRTGRGRLNRGWEEEAEAGGM